MKTPVIAAAAVTLFFACWIPSLEDRSPLEGLITNPNNQIRRGDAYVLAKKEQEHFDPTDAQLYLSDTKVSGWAQTLCNFSAYAGQFGTVFGLCSTPYFHIERVADPVTHDDVDMVYDETPFVVNGKPPDDWRERLLRSPTLKSFTAQNADYVVTAVFLPQTESELLQAERGVKIAQMGQGISWYKIWDLNVHSLWGGVTAIGWTIGRYLIHVRLVASIMLLAVLGVGIVLLLMFRSIFGNWRLAWIAVIHIWAAFVCQLGAMAMFGISRSVFTLLAQMIPFLMGTSAIPEIFEKREEARRPLKWTAALTIVGFYTLIMPFFGFEVKHVQEFAYAGMLGALFMVPFAMYSFPCFLRKDDIPQNVTNSWVNRVSAYLAQKFNMAALWLSEGWRAPSLVAGVMALFLGTIGLVYAGSIKTATDSLLFIKGSSVAQGIRVVNAPGGMGQELVDMLLECRNGKTFNDSACAREMILWYRAVETDFAAKHPELRTTFSMVKLFDEVAVGTEEHPGILGRLPEDREDVGVVWPSIKDRLAHMNQPGKPTYQSQLWCLHDNCFRVILGFGVQTDADLRAGEMALDEFNRQFFPNLQMHFFGKNALYAELGPYVTEGKIQNTVTSTFSVGLTILVFLWMIQRGMGMRALSPWKGGLISMIPFLFAPSVFLLMLWLTKGVLDVVSATISSFAIAAAGDFILLLLYAFVDNIKAHPELSLYDVFRLTIEEEGPLRVRDMFINVLCFSIFALCVLFEPVQMLGVAMMLITFLCLIGTLVFSAALFYRILRPKEKPILIPVARTAEAYLAD